MKLEELFSQTKLSNEYNTEVMMSEFLKKAYQPVEVSLCQGHF
jgi:hypothetical protein